ITRLVYFMQRAWYQRYLGAGVTALYRYAHAGVGALCSMTYTGGAYVRALFEDASEQAISDDYTDVLMQHTQSAESAYNQMPEATVVRVPLVKRESAEQAHEAQHARRYRLPSVSLFTHVHEAGDNRSKDELESLARVLEEKLERFGIKGSVVACKRGPVVTLFEYQPDIDAKLSKIVSLEDDLALALRALSIRILAPIPGKSVVGFEVSNATRKSVFLSPIIQSREYEQYAGVLPLILGEDTFGSRVMVDLATMPHLLVAGSTGSGKSVALNVMLVSLLCKRSPQELQLILIDPKRLEFAAYADSAHLIFPIVTDPKRAAPVLAWVVHEMERRYTVMAQRSTRTIADYNVHVQEQEKLPYIVVVIDELADLMMTAGKEVEDAIARITQMARAAGIHMIVATQRPSVDVITGVIKVNFPSRISFRVMSKIDSRTILDSAGAEKLLGRGDMLFIDGQGASVKRVHGAYVHDADIKQVVDHIKSQQLVVYQDIVHPCAVQIKAGAEIEDVLYQDVVRFLGEVDDVSISLLQRKFRIGYNRSARLIELLEMHGLIMPTEGGKTRKVIR
ncbi:MAG: DNA translocase FtsK, partial [Candidatus Babeliales bacterium]